MLSSFGYWVYWGYCLLKDTKHLRANYVYVPNNIIGAIVDSNTTHKDFIIKRNPKVVGIYRLVMRIGSDNFRASATEAIMKRIKGKGIEVVVYDPVLEENEFIKPELV